MQSKMASIRFIKREARSIKSSFNKQQIIISGIAILILISQIVTIVRCRYLPSSSGLQRRQDDIDSDSDGDGDELDSNASSPYQNQEDGGGRDGDSYGDNEPDGPYEETPADADGQADLERFFDDHLGASEKDGMDKENLPTNIVPTFISLYNNDAIRANLVARPNERDLIPMPSETNYAANNMEQQQQFQNHQQAQEQKSSLPNVETRYIQLPNNKLIITRQITQGPIYKGGLDLPEIPPIPQHIFQDKADYVEPQGQPDSLKATGSEVVSTEDDDFDKVYVTKLNNQPFKIAALGGYDPEEDFNDASQDFEESTKTFDSKRKASRALDDGDADAGDGLAANGGQESQQRDISFNDPEPDMLFNDASETDEVTFGQDDPYQTDLEAEMHATSYDKPGKPTSKFYKAPNDDAHSKPSSSHNKHSKIRAPVKYVNDDDSEGSWVNDGVEDMDIPSQSDQETVLAKAAKQEELARQAADAENDPEAQQQDEPDNQRMANADYLKDDLKSIDETDDSAL